MTTVKGRTVSHTKALALHATGLAMLADGHTAADVDVVDELVELASGDPAALHDARDLLHDIHGHPDRVERADLLILRAITRVEQASGTVDASLQLRALAAETRARARKLREDLPLRDEAGSQDDG